MPTAYISVGSNIEPRKNLIKAIRLLSEMLELTAVSTVYRTKPELNKDQPYFYDCVVSVKTDLSPKQLKYRFLRKVEKALGRKRSKDKFASRPIDLDLIAYSGLKEVMDPEISHRKYLQAGLGELKAGLPPIKKGSLPGMTPLHGYTKLLRRGI
jgi:2-amino-4-hydroxy-6-hydroxymethyldihydropteridine diphosphokinase